MSDHTCPDCESSTFTMLGPLGSTMWLRCRMCGTEIGIEASAGIDSDDDESLPDTVSDWLDDRDETNHY